MLNIILKVLLIIVPLIIVVAYYTYVERKIIGFMQDRIGPNRVGKLGLLQPIVDALKLIFKEMIILDKANKKFFFIAPILSFIPAYAAWAVIPFNEHIVLSNINSGMLYILAMTSMTIYGIIIAGWSSNSKYPIFGALRAAAQVISYEIPMSLSILGVLIAAGSLNLSSIVNTQTGGIFHWYFIPLFPLFVIYFISGIAETGRAPFDVIEGESEIVAGHHVEYSGARFALFFLAEYANMILISLLTVILFFGGWKSPFENIYILETVFFIIPGMMWLFIKTGIFMFIYIWIRATFPRYRYDQIMYLNWKIFIPISLFWVILICFMVKIGVGPWWK